MSRGKLIVIEGKGCQYRQVGDAGHTGNGVVGGIQPVQLAAKSQRRQGTDGIKGDV